LLTNLSNGYFLALAHGGGGQPDDYQARKQLHYTFNFSWHAQWSDATAVKATVIYVMHQFSSEGGFML
jgi:hypothetical protein